MADSKNSPAVPDKGASFLSPTLLSILIGGLVALVGGGIYYWYYVRDDKDDEEVEVEVVDACVITATGYHKQTLYRAVTCTSADGTVGYHAEIVLPGGSSTGTAYKTAPYNTPEKAVSAAKTYIDQLLSLAGTELPRQQ